LFVKNSYWIVLDEIESTGKHNADLWFHFDAGANPLIEASDGAEIVLAEAGEQRGLDIAVFGDTGRWRREEGWVSHCYASREPARVYAYSRKPQAISASLRFFCRALNAVATAFAP
jgi:hypothetical protein